MFPIEKYEFIVAGNKVIALSTYAGKTVRGIAVCSPEDDFDLEYGKRLAAARCNTKVCEKRRKRAEKKKAEAERYYFIAKEYFKDMNDYYRDAVEDHYEAMLNETDIEFGYETEE